MIRRLAMVGAVVVAAGGAMLAVSEGTSWAWSAGEAAAAGAVLYQANCASCHGADLEGQANWQQRNRDGRLLAPPHDVTGHTWHHSDEQLFALVKDGPAAMMPGYETDMPGFAGVLSDAEIHSVLDFIKGTWPAEQRDYQAARSKAGQ